MQELEDEIWKVIPDNPLYMCSSLGRVKSKAKYKEWTLLKFKKVSDTGYYCTSLGRKNPKKIHALVALTFLGYPDGRHINHKNGVKTDNRLENLEYVTQTENNQHAVRTGLINNKGGNHGLARFTDIQVLAIKEALLSGHKSCNIARYFKAPPSTICNIRKGRSYIYLFV